MSLLAAVVGALEGAQIRGALIGAGAMAVHGVSRSTADVDLLVVDARAMSDETWRGLGPGIVVEVRRGDADDPLGGIVRFTRAGDRPVDLVVGRARWQSPILDRAIPADFDGLRLLVARAADLILLKLFAGGPQDLWDVGQLLAGDRGPALTAEVDEHIGVLPADAQRLWRQVKTEER